MTLDVKSLNEILTYLDKSITNLAKDAFESMEIEGGAEGITVFLDGQYDIRLENLLVAKKSSIHHLESGMKNITIQRKQKILEDVTAKYQS